MVRRSRYLIIPADRLRDRLEMNAFRLCQQRRNWELETILESVMATLGAQNGVARRELDLSDFEELLPEVPVH